MFRQLGCEGGGVLNKLLGQLLQCLRHVDVDLLRHVQLLQQLLHAFRTEKFRLGRGRRSYPSSNANRGGLCGVRSGPGLGDAGTNRLTGLRHLRHENQRIVEQKGWSSVVPKYIMGWN